MTDQMRTSEMTKIKHWVEQTYGLEFEATNDLLLLMLYKLHLLEEKINKIESQTKTHWVN